MNISSFQPSPSTSSGVLSANDLLPANQRHSGAVLTSGLQPVISPQIANVKQTALELFERILSVGYTKLGLLIDKPAAQYPHFGALTAEKVADNIMGFIARRLQMDVVDGATQEQLQSRLDAGLAGFKQGFAEASEKLKALSLLSPEIDQDIGKTYELVLNGVEQLRQEFTPIEKVESLPISQENTLPKSAFANATHGSYSYARANSFSFELITAEGDRVTVAATSRETHEAEFFSGNKINSSQLQISTSSSDSFNWLLEGDLNKNELTAINQLLGQVNQLADQFFNGDLDLAFNQALALGYDEKQISSFSLSLTQVEVQRVSATYQRFNEASSSTSPLLEQLLPLGHFIKHLWDVVDELQEFPEPESLLLDVAGKMLSPTLQDENEVEAALRFSNFIQEMLQNRTTIMRQPV